VPALLGNWIDHPHFLISRSGGEICAAAVLKLVKSVGTSGEQQPLAVILSSCKRLQRRQFGRAKIVVPQSDLVRQCTANLDRTNRSGLMCGQRAINLCEAVNTDREPDEKPAHLSLSCPATKVAKSTVLNIEELFLFPLYQPTPLDANEAIWRSFRSRND
jgi:hypothetical protein